MSYTDRTACAVVEHTLVKEEGRRLFVYAGLIICTTESKDLRLFSVKIIDKTSRLKIILFDQLYDLFF